MRSSFQAQTFPLRTAASTSKGLNTPHPHNSLNEAFVIGFLSNIKVTTGYLKQQNIQFKTSYDNNLTTIIFAFRKARMIDSGLFGRSVVRVGKGEALFRRSLFGIAETLRTGERSTALR